MCGIVGCTGEKKAIHFLLDGLTKLEYRGYDSAGFVSIDAQSREIAFVRSVGNIHRLRELSANLSGEFHTALGHTRWATHGEVSEKNAHPLTNAKQNIFVVLNGIIENYQSLKQVLSSKKEIEWKSQTDVEILPYLIDLFLEEGSSLLEAIQETTLLLEGNFSFVVFHKDYPENLYGVALGSPLCVGSKEESKTFYIASDPLAFAEKSQDVIYLQDREMVVIEEDKMFFLDLMTQKPIPKTSEWYNIESAVYSKGSFDHFMLKEIYDQPASVASFFLGRIVPEEFRVHLGGFHLSAQEWKKVRQIVFIGCGSSWISGLYGKYLIEKLTTIPVSVEVASEFCYSSRVHSDHLYITISQSGETADTLSAIKMIKSRNIPVYSITNVPGSSIARLVDGGIYTRAGMEYGVAATKSLLNQILSTLLIGLQAAIATNSIEQELLLELFSSMQSLSPKILHTIENLRSNIQKLAGVYKDISHVLFMGRGFNYPVALEGALKLKELTYIPSEGYPAAEMKHGPLALVDEHCLVITLATKDVTLPKIISNMQEVSSRKGNLLVITHEYLKDKFQFLPQEHHLYIEETSPLLQGILNIVPLQLFAYELALIKGNNVDRPRNLAKSVTVE